MAWRTFWLLNGGCRWLKRISPIEPSGSVFSIFTSLFFASSGIRSGGSCCHQSTWPVLSAAAAVAASGM